MKLILATFFVFALVLSACTTGEMMEKESAMPQSPSEEMTEFVTKHGGTEQPFENAYWDNYEPGIYVDANTGEPLFSSIDKYDSGTGWPSFTQTIDGAPVQEEQDNSLGMKRTEVKTEDSHLGHVFDDGPDGGDRYCINSAALRFIPYKDLDKEGFAEYKQDFKFETATLAGGCFWGVEHLLQEVEGVENAVSGYMGGVADKASYRVVSSGLTGHAESVQIEFDPNRISYSEVLDVFWRLHDPTQKNRQGWDVGPQYRSAIFYHSEEQKTIAEASKAAFDAKGVFDKLAVTEIVPAGKFFPAEEYHQDYYELNTGKVCHALRDE